MRLIRAELLRLCAEGDEEGEEQPHDGVVITMKCDRTIDVPRVGSSAYSRSSLLFALAPALLRPIPLVAHIASSQAPAQEEADPEDERDEDDVVDRRDELVHFFSARLIRSASSAISLASSA